LLICEIAVALTNISELETFTKWNCNTSPSPRQFYA
jgi:hypothetical protein